MIPKTGVVLVAAGKGVRAGGPVPKQFAQVGGRPLFAHSLRFFASLPFVTQIVVVAPALGGLPADGLAQLEGLAVAVQVVPGGARRQDSAATGLAALAPGFEVAMVHDAARPFPSREAVEELARRAVQTGGGLLAQRCVDTVKVATPDGCVGRTLDRDTIWLAQTPQAIRADLVARAIEAFGDPACTLTDEASLLESWGVRVALVESSSANFKVTTPEDLQRAEALLGGV